MNRSNCLPIAFLILVLVLIPLAAFPQFLGPSDDELAGFILLLGDFAAKSALEVSLLITQALFIVLRTRMGNFLGIHKVLVLAVLSLVVTIGTKYLAGLPLTGILGDATVIWSLQIAYNQVGKQWRKRKRDREKLLSVSTESLRMHDNTNS